MPAAGYMFTYYNSKVTKEREAQIDRVNAQVPPLPVSSGAPAIPRSWPAWCCSAGVTPWDGLLTGAFLCKILSSQSPAKVSDRVGGMLLHAGNSVHLGAVYRSASLRLC